VYSSPEDQSVRIALAGFGWIVTAMLFGELVHNRRLLLEQAAERAARERAETQAEADRRIADERLRIARDVHDVLAHTVSVMTVQAGVAADVFERDPRSARSALSKVRAAGREALTEVRATVAVLRGARPAERRRRQSWTRRLQTKWRIRALASSCSSDPGGHHGRRVITNDGTRAK
jgi:signal transduction histidine kinase